MIFQKKSIFFAAWDYYVHIIVTNNFDATAHKLKLERDDTDSLDDKTVGGVCFHVKDNGVSYLFIRPKAIVRVVAHEAWHCVCRILEYADAELDNETVAYHLGYLTGEAYAFAHKRRKR